jgi:uncharacterized protein with GYD domain
VILNEEGAMATYIMLSTLTDDGSETLKENPSRLKEVNKEIEGMGVKIMSQYATLGPYDFVNIIEAPDNETVARLSVELGGRGSVKLLTMPAIPIDRFIASLQPQKK